MQIFDWSCIGFTGVAHAGKDEAAKALLSLGYQRHNMGDLIKRDLDPIVQKRLGFSAFTEDPEQKKIIRKMLEEVGDAMYESYMNEYFATMPQRAVSSRVQRKQEAEEWRKRNHPIILIARRLENGSLLVPSTSFEKRTMEEIQPYITHTLVNDGSLLKLQQAVLELLRFEYWNYYSSIWNLWLPNKEKNDE